MKRRHCIASRLLYADLDSKIKYLAQRLQGKVPNPEAYIRALVPLDPSGNKGDYLGALIAYKQSGKRITPKVQEALAWHFKYKSYLPVELRDANKLDLKSFPSQLNSLRKLHKTPDYQPKGAKVIYTEGPYSVVEITDREAACHFFELGGRWCTGNPETSTHFKSYTISGPLYIILKNSKPWAQWSSRGELKNSQNQDLRLKDQFSILTLLSKALPGNAQVEESLDSVNQSLAPYRDMEKVLSSPELSYLYALHILNSPFPAGEAKIARDAVYSYLYARYVLLPSGIKGFPAGEPAIAENAEYSYDYALGVLEAPFPAGEPAIARYSGYSYLYALDVLLPLEITSFPAGEPVMSQDAVHSYYYARDVLDTPFPLGEPAIATNAQYSFLYALDVLLPSGVKGFPAGEPAITKDVFYSYRYALKVLQDPDPSTWGSRYLAQHQGARA